MSRRVLFGGSAGGRRRAVLAAFASAQLPADVHPRPDLPALHELRAGDAWLGPDDGLAAASAVRGTAGPFRMVDQATPERRKRLTQLQRPRRR